VFGQESNLVAICLGGTYVRGIYGLAVRSDGTVAGGECRLGYPM
jgi:hypothetical protein